MIQFPIQGSFREIILMVEMIIVVLNIQFAIIFLNRYLKQKGVKNNMYIAWTILFFCFAITYFLFILTDFYVSPNDRPFFLNISYIFIGSGQTLLFYNIEREMKSEKYIFTKIVLGVLSFFIINTIFNLIYSTPFSTIYWGLFFVLLIIFGNKYLTRIRQTWKLNIYGFIIGATLTIIGWGGISDLGMSILGIEFRLFGDLFIITGTSLMTLFFVGLPRLSEIDYFEKVKRIFIMHNSGIPIFEQTFKKEQDFKETDLRSSLFAGGLTTVSQWITDLIQSKGHLEIVDHGDVKIIFEYGKYTINVLIVEEVLNILKNKLKTITNEVENLYQDILPTWEGDMSPFELLKNIIQQNFEI